jgi:hypothetical protein
VKQAAMNPEIERLLQIRRIAVIENPTAPTFVPVYTSESLRDGFHCFSYLLPIDQKDAFLANVGWDLRNDNFRPSVQWEERNVDGKRERRVFYMQRGNESGAEALVRQRFYWKNYPAEIEIAEEFRLFWNLFHDQARQILLHCDKDGTEHTVVRITDSCVEVQLKFLVDFLRAKQMHLALQWEGNYWSQSALDAVGLKPAQRENSGDLFRWWLCVSDRNPSDEFKSISRLLGKAIIPCPGKLTYSDPYDTEDTTHPAFVIGIDPTGHEITDAWSDSQGNDNALTPVFFRRVVLAKYFAEPERYEVDDGSLRCPGFWDLRMDNDHPQHIVAWLKDLAQSLPTAEREHWRSYNIAPDGVPSRTFYTRNIRGWFADPTMPDLRLKMLYRPTNEAWSKRFGWPLWCDPKSEDQYVFRQLHVCLDENQSEFDQQNGLLAKVVVDFLNVDEITKALNVPKPPGGGLNRLELFLTKAGFAAAKPEVESLRVIQNLRSAGAAHTKGEQYAAAMKRGGLLGLPLVDASMKVFQGAVTFVEWVRNDILEIKDTGPPPLDS